MLKFEGHAQFRLRLALATLSGRPLRISNIRAEDQNPGLRDFEASLLRLLEKITNGCVVEINETGTTLRYKPGILVGGAGLAHDCPPSTSIGWFLEPLLLLAMFGKKPLAITLRGVTNDHLNPTVDAFRTVTLPLLRKAAGLEDGLELRVVRRGAAPLGGGEVELRVPIIKALPGVTMTDEGMVRRIRGIAYTMKVSPQNANRMVDAARGPLNDYLADVYIFTDAMSGRQAGDSPGYGITLVAETTSGCLIHAEACAAQGGAGQQHNGQQAAAGPGAGGQQRGQQQRQAAAGEQRRRGLLDSDDDDDGAGTSSGSDGSGGEEGGRPVSPGRGAEGMQWSAGADVLPAGEEALVVPEDLGRAAALRLLDKVRAGGVVDASHQALLLCIAALGPPEINQVRLGQLTPYAIHALRLLKDCLDVRFDLRPERTSDTVFCSCIGAGTKNLARRVT